MNKKSFLTIIVGSAILLSGCLGKNAKTNTVTISEGQSAPEVISEWQKVGRAIADGKSVSCEMTNKENNFSSKYYMKEQKVRFDSTISEDKEMNNSFLTDGEFAYSWNKETKKGMKFSVKDAKEIPEDFEDQNTEAPDFSSKESWDEYQNSGFTVTCEITPVDDKMFVPPSDVNFTDMDEFTKQMQQMDSADGVDQAKIEQMMKQFQEVQ